MVLATTINGGLSGGWSIFSALNSFYLIPGDTSKRFPKNGYTYPVEAVQLAVDPNVSGLDYCPGGVCENDHDVWLYITTGNGVGGRTFYLIEFLVHNDGTLQQVSNNALGTNWWPQPTSGLCPLGNGSCESNVDTLTMVVGHQKSCGGISGWDQPFLYAIWASLNPITDATCPSTNKNNITWAGNVLLDPDSSTGYYTGALNTSGLAFDEPDCVGNQVNWPAIALTADLANQTTPGGGGSVRLAFSIPESNGGQGIAIWNTNPLGCSDAGSNCYNCCATSPCNGGTPSNSTPGWNQGGVCQVPGAGPVDCNSSSCTGSCKSTHVGDSILPEIAFNDPTFTTGGLSVTWYDNRDSTGTGQPFGEIRGVSGKVEYGANLPHASTLIVAQDTESSSTAPKNACIGMGSSPTDATHWFGASNGSSTIYDWFYSN